jgi:hypothetical protein
LMFSASGFGQSTAAYTDVHDFNGTIINANGASGPDGYGPVAAVTFDSAGNMYGTASLGGANGFGMAWEMTASGTYRDLHDFGGTIMNANGTSGPDGYSPVATLTFDSAGNMYGTAGLGGPFGRGMAWEITAAGAYRDLHDFGGTIINANGASGPDGYNPKSTFNFDRAGNMYGTTTYGGGNGFGMIWEITASGTYWDLHDFGGTVTNADGMSGTDGSYPDSGVTFGSAGNMVGSAWGGGANHDGMVWEITASGTYRDLHDFGGTVTNADGTSGPDGSDPVAGVTFDSAGNMYGTAEYGGPNYVLSSGGAVTDYGGIVWEITALGEYRDLHDFGGMISNANGTNGPDGVLPFAGVTFDTAGDMYGTASGGGPNGVSNGGDGMVWEMTVSGTYRDLHDFGGTIINAGGTSGSDGYEPKSAVTFDSAGNMVGTALEGGAHSGGMAWTLASGPSLKSVSVSPASAQGGASSTGTVTLSQAAASGGVVVPLSSSSVSATVPASVTVVGGAATATFTVSTTGVNTQAAVTITAGSGSGAQSVTLTITPARLVSVALNPTSVVGGNSSTGSVTLSGPAGPGGTAVSLASSNSSAVVPVSVTVPASETSVTFTVNTTGVSAQAQATITGTLNSQDQMGALTITPASLGIVSVSPSIVVGGKPSTGMVVLTGDAGSAGLLVTLSCKNAAAMVPKSVTVLAGQGSATFAITTKALPKQAVVTIIAKSGSASKSASLTITPPKLASVSLNPTTVYGGVSSTGTVTLSGPAPVGGVVVKLSSGSKAAALPSSVAIGSGKMSATFTVKPAAVLSPTTATITATLSSVSQTATLTIDPPTLLSLTLNPTSVKGGRSSTGTVTLTSIAPTGGFVISLSSSASSATVPASVKIQSGRTSATFTVKAKPVSASTTATITATLESVSKTAVLSISP